MKSYLVNYVNTGSYSLVKRRDSEIDILSLFLDMDKCVEETIILNLNIHFNKRLTL